MKLQPTRAAGEGQIAETPLSEAYDVVLKGRRSVRRYLPDPVPEDDLQAILEQARWAPSPHNSEPWRFAVLRTTDVKERLATAMGERWVQDLQGDGWTPEAIERELRISRRRIVEAPVVIVACLVDEGLDEYPDPIRQLNEQLMAAHSLGAAVQNVMVGAYARGLGTCWMCAPLFCPDVVVRALRLPTEYRPQGLITLGYPVAWPDARERRPMPDLVMEVR
jgi:F420 biosynthesis protein FbiB-like protein